MPDNPETTTATKNLRWILASVFTVAMLFLVMITSGFGSMYSFVAEDVDVNREDIADNSNRITKNEVNIDNMESLWGKMDEKLDRIDSYIRK